MLFRYTGIDKSGAKSKGSLEAKSLEHAKGKLKSQGILYQNIEEDKPTFIETISLFGNKTIPPNKLAILSRDLSIYLKAGVPLVNAIRLGVSQYRNDLKMKRFLESLLIHMEEGKSFFQALESQRNYVVPEFYKQSVKISENGGMISDVLSQMSSFISEQEKLSKQIKSAMTYPTFIIVVSVMMISFMLTVVVPKITSIFETMHQELPLITRVVVSSADFLTSYGLHILASIIGLIAIFIYALKSNIAFKTKIHRLLLSLWPFGKIIQVGELARFSYMLAVLIRSGVPFAQSVRLGANTLNNIILQNKFLDSANRVVEGEKLSSALQRSGFEIEPTFVEALSLGEETSEIPVMMENLSSLYFEENRDKIGTFLSLLEPFMMLFVGGVIGVIVMAMLLPIFSLNIG